MVCDFLSLGALLAATKLKLKRVVNIPGPLKIYELELFNRILSLASWSVMYP